MRQLTIHFDPGLAENQTFFNNLHARQGSFLHSILFGSGLVKRVRVKDVSKKQIKIKDTGKKQSKLNADKIAEALGAELVGHLTLIDGINFQDLTITLEPDVEFQPELNYVIFKKDTRKIQFECTRILKVVNEKNKTIWEMRR